MKNVLLLCFALLLLGFAAAPAASAAEASVAVNSPALAVAPLELGNASGSCAGSSASDVLSPATPEWLAASSCCRPQCGVDSNCDAICGVGLGQCRVVNSCCKQCFCAALSF
jgi:hypothetical protein